MKTHFAAKAALTLIALSMALTAADVTGTWLYERTASDGAIFNTYFTLKQEGSTLAGSITFPGWNTSPLTGTVKGDQISFSSGGANPDRRTAYTGELSGEELKLTSKRGNQVTTLQARRVPEASAKPPALIPPPELHPVPDNGLVKAPPMGWNSWNHFQGKVDDATVRSIAEAMVSNGMKTAGYVYVNIDDTWEASRAANGTILANKKFPDMKALADFVHSKGLKLGIYSSPGPKTCAGYEGSYGHEEQDAKTYAAWGIDYLKYDWCSAGRIYQPVQMQAVYQKMGAALQASGRGIVYSLCQYGQADVWQWGPSVGGNLWRTTGDISDSWKSMSKIGFDQEKLAPFAKPGHWNDPDMLEIGNGGMSDTEYRTHMSLWAMLAAPLLAGNDLRNASRATLDILTNSEVIAIDQDPAGKQGHRVSEGAGQEVWIRPLAAGAQAVALFNRAEASGTMTVKWADFGLSKSPRVRDVWAHKEVSSEETYSIEVPAHGTVLLRVSPAE